MWLGEQITERGIGNGISLIIFAGIVTDMPDAAVRMFSKAKTGDITAFDLAVIGLLIVLVVGGRSSSSNAGSDESPSSTPSASSGGRCTAASRPTCRSR